MKKIKILLLILLFVTNIFAQKNSYTYAVKLLDLNQKINKYISDTADSNIRTKVKEELTKMTNAAFTTALMTKNFWNLSEPDQNKIFKYCDTITSKNNKDANFPNLTKIFEYSSSLRIFENKINQDDNTDNKFLKSIPSEAIIIQGITNFVAKKI